MDNYIKCNEIYEEAILDMNRLISAMRKKRELRLKDSKCASSSKREAALFVDLSKYLSPDSTEDSKYKLTAENIRQQFCSFLTSVYLDIYSSCILDKPVPEFAGNDSMQRDAFDAIINYFGVLFSKYLFLNLGRYDFDSTKIIVNEEKNNNATDGIHFFRPKLLEELENEVHFLSSSGTFFPVYDKNLNNYYNYRN